MRSTDIGAVSLVVEHPVGNNAATRPAPSTTAALSVFLARFPFMIVPFIGGGC